MKNDKISANIDGEMLGDKRAHILYEDPEGKKFDISFQWRTEKKGSGGYFSMDEYYVETHVSERGFLKSKETYTNNRKVGEDVWISRPAGGGSKEQGIQSFDQFLQNKEVFNDISDEKLRAMLYKAQDSAKIALHDYYENYNKNQNKLAILRKKVARSIDKALGTKLAEKKLAKPLKNIERPYLINYSVKLKSEYLFSLFHKFILLIFC